ncbi:hypothetical protein CKM354_000176900 [Cercospora kikuchii]|uniref:Uncharacterized protein n=1 Tax=Cercospora kikuchii TaxID=84275 RepID=A0A9P3CE65_9PEZI|nr:uncharacterized protein CKM354_000176900 [Cercospora kikuchii]GIZ38350.1 hypothetical protein CKM354_000176900 [Cercospora kikuchii]
MMSNQQLATLLRQVQLKDLLLSSEPAAVASFLEQYLTESNSAALLLSAHQALEVIYDRNRALLSEARDTEDVDVEVAELPRQQGWGLTAADAAEAVIAALSIEQRDNRIMEISREVLEVRRMNRVLTHRIKARLEENTEEWTSDMNTLREEEERRRTARRGRDTKRCQVS